MHATLSIKDLPLGADLDRKAMRAVHGGVGDQAIGTSGANVQEMATATNVGNGARFAGPATIQSDQTFRQDDGNTNFAANLDFLLFWGLGLPVRRY